jgi:hypothetical protein
MVHLVQGAAGKEAKQTAAIKGKMTYLWPILFTETPLSMPSLQRQPPLESPKFGQELADIGYARYKKYCKEVLPRELELDNGFAELYRTSDHSRANAAFKRWQTRAFASRDKVPVSRLLARAEAAPKLPGINYEWPELYDSPQYMRLIQRVRQLSKLWLKRAGYPQEETQQKLLVYPWVEVYDHGDAMRPFTRSDGAYIFARYFAKAAPGMMKFNFEDPRGINPPFGKTFTYSVHGGELTMLPSWASTFTTPNMVNNSVVCYCFLIYPADGRIKWSSDVSGQLTISNNFTVNIKKPRPKK